MCLRYTAMRPSDPRDDAASRPDEPPESRRLDCSSGRWQFATLVCASGEYNEIRSRLPRWLRRNAPRAGHDQVGVIVQAIAPGDYPIATKYALVPTGDDATQVAARLKREVRAMLQ